MPGSKHFATHVETKIPYKISLPIISYAWCTTSQLLKCT